MYAFVALAAFVFIGKLYSPGSYPEFPKMPGNNMKQVRGGGARRTKDPDVDSDYLLDKLRAWVKACKIPASAFDLGQYNRLTLGQAAHGKSLFQLRDLITLFLAVSPLAKIGYLQFKPVSCKVSTCVIDIVSFCRSVQLVCVTPCVVTPCNNSRTAFGMLKKEFPDAFPEALDLKADDADRFLAERCGTLLNHLRRVSNSKDRTRWKQCTNCLQDYETAALSKIVMTLKEAASEATRDASPGSFVSREAETPRKSLVRNHSLDSAESIDSEGFAKVPDFPWPARKSLVRHHSLESGESMDSEGFAKVPVMNFPVLLPKKALELSKKPAAALAALKRPAAAISEPKAQNPKAKAKAVASKANGKAKAKAKAKPRAVSKWVKPANALIIKPNGCSKCRWTPGCTNSCFRQRGYK